MSWTKKSIDLMLSLYDSHTYKEISAILKKRFGIKKTPNAIRKAYFRHKLPVQNFSKAENLPKILVLDIETKPLTSFVWSLWVDRIGLNQIETDWSILSWCAKWLGDEEIFYEDLRDAKDVENDKKLLKNIWRLLDEADIIITQNGKKFDIPKLNARFVLNGMKPPSSFRQIDTYQIARKHFKFTSNKLEYLTDKLCTKHKKSKHKKYHGFELWKACMRGDIEAWKEMEDYNVIDVLSLEELYYKLAPWDNSINFSLYSDEITPTCSCGSKSFSKSGFYYTNASKFQKYKCTECGREHRDKKNLLSKEKKKNMITPTVR